MEGLQCLGPTELQCHQMQVECICPLNSQPIESWDASCTPKPEGVYRLDGETLRCMTCDEFLDSLTGFSAGDFGCRIGSLATDADGDGASDGALDVWETDCLPGEVGAVSGAACPHLTAPEPEPEVGPSFIDTDQEVNCGAHGTLVDGSCQCDMEANGLKCWQTNRERSNRYPNGNIMEWCSVAMCNMNSEGQLVEASAAQTATPEDCSTTDAGCDVVTQMAYAFGVSKQVIFGTWALLLFAGCFMAYSCLCSHGEYDSDNDESAGYSDDKLKETLIKRSKYLDGAPTEDQISAMSESKARSLLLDAEFYRKKAHHDEKTRIIEDMRSAGKLHDIYMRSRLFKHHEHDMEKKIRKAGGTVPEAAPSLRVYALIEAAIECDPEWTASFKDDEAGMLANVRRLHLKPLQRFARAAKGAAHVFTLLTLRRCYRSKYDSIACVCPNAPALFHMRRRL
eukprot:COSAG02_NODE_305_length_25176_cov_30.787455_8_plen_453_part_00